MAILHLRAAMTMKAAVLRSFGTEEALAFTRDLARPVVGCDEVLVRVKACALSALDIQVRTGKFEDMVRLPVIPGYEISGVVAEVGSGVMGTGVGEDVAGIIPLDGQYGGCGELAVLKSYEFVKKPALTSHEDAAACLLSGLRASTALFSQAALAPGETVLICDGASASGHIAVQLAGQVGARIITTVSTSEEYNYLQNITTTIARIIDSSREKIMPALMEETGGLGVDVLLESMSMDMKRSISLSTGDILRCLAPHGRWVTSGTDVQLDPPDAYDLFRKNASISFLFEQAWLLSGSQQGRYLHILTDVLERVSKGEIKPNISRQFSLEKIREAHRCVEEARVGKIIVKQ